MKAVFGLLVLYLAWWAVLWALARRKEPLKVWHRARLPELGPEDYPAELTVTGLEARETALFEALDEAVCRRVEAEDRTAYNRYFRESVVHPAAAASRFGLERDYNRTFALEPAVEPRGAALLVHGLTDSPYSMRRTAEILRDEGLRVLCLRLPGHGTIPGALVEVHRAAWSAAVAWGVERVREAAGGGPFFLGGYSTGGALVLDWVLRRLADGRTDALPRRLLLFSPSIGVSRLAAVTDWHKVYSFLPGLARYKWLALDPEYDSFKYNSFPKNGADQVHLQTKELRRAIRALQGRLGDLPPILAFQSVIDTSVEVKDLVESLFGRLEAGRSELVLFDINRLGDLKDFVRRAAREVFAELDLDTMAPAGYRLTLVTNAGPDSAAVVAKSKAPGAATFEPPVDLGLAWPPNVYSQAHVSIPFPPDDPLYGDFEDEDRLSLGSLAPRGERQVLTLSLDNLMRLRHNVFFSYVERRLREAVRESLA